MASSGPEGRFTAGSHQLRHVRPRQAAEEQERRARPETDAAVLERFILLRILMQPKLGQRQVDRVAEDERQEEEEATGEGR